MRIRMRSEMISERDQTKKIALEMISEGADPQGLVHVLYSSDAGSGYLGVSSPLPAGSVLAGYTSRYFTLAELARG